MASLSANAKVKNADRPPNSVITGIMFIGSKTSSCFFNGTCLRSCKKRCPEEQINSSLVL